MRTTLNLDDEALAGALEIAPGRDRDLETLMGSGLLGARLLPVGPRQSE